VTGAAGTTEIATGDGKSIVLLSVFTDTMVQSWNNEPGANPFPYSPDVLRAALKYPLGTPFPDIHNAVVVEVNHYRALRFTVEGPYGVQVTYYFQRGQNGFLEANLILWNDRNMAHVLKNRPVPYETRKALDAAQAVLDTIVFFNPKDPPRRVQHTVSPTPAPGRPVQPALLRKN